MGKVIVYVAQSLDGYIARKDGDISWLSRYENQGEDHGYKEFLRDVATLVVGSATYEQVLAFAGWPYGDKKTYVLTGRDLKKAPGADIEFYAGDLSRLLGRIRSKSDKNIWIVGGAQVVSSLLNEKLVDELMVFIVPILLAEGIGLFASLERETELTLIGSKRYQTGIVLTHYEVAKER